MGLIGGGSEEKEREESVRMPTTIKRIQKLKAMRRAKQEKLRREMEDDDDDDDDDEDDPADVAVQPAPPTLRASAPAPSSSNTVADASVDLLNFDAPTDFTRPVDTSSLPPMRTFDISRCEKGPLASSGPRAQQDLAQPEVAPSAASSGMPCTALRPLRRLQAQHLAPIPAVSTIFGESASRPRLPLHRGHAPDVVPRAVPLRKHGSLTASSNMIACFIWELSPATSAAFSRVTCSLRCVCG